MTDGSPPGRRARAPQVGLACNEDVRRRYVDDADLARLEAVADFSYQAFSVASRASADPAPGDADGRGGAGRFAADLDVLVVCHGAPFVSADVLERAPRAEPARRARGRPVRPTASTSRPPSARGVRVVDTSHGSSWPAAEWALGLALVGLRNAGALFRAHDRPRERLRPGGRALGPGLRRRRAEPQAGRPDRLRPPRAPPRRAAAALPGRRAASSTRSSRGSWPSLTESSSGRSQPSSECDVVFVLVPHTPRDRGDARAPTSSTGSGPGACSSTSPVARWSTAPRSSAACSGATSSPAWTSSTPSRCRSTRPSSTCRTSSVSPTSPGSPRRAGAVSSRSWWTSACAISTGFEPWSELTPGIVRLRAARARSAPAGSAGAGAARGSTQRPAEHRRRSSGVKNGAVRAHGLERLAEGAESLRGREVRAPAEPLAVRRRRRSGAARPRVSARGGPSRRGGVVEARSLHVDVRHRGGGNHLVEPCSVARHGPSPPRWWQSTGTSGCLRAMHPQVGLPGRAGAEARDKAALRRER